MPKTKFAPGDVLRWNQSPWGRDLHQKYGEPFLVISASGDSSDRTERYELEGLEGSKQGPRYTYNWSDSCFIKDEFLSAVKHALQGYSA